jgi:3-hydroxymyristoyl/3-hydroxydecanoyl-(acyl carrier protein) dehydratase
MTKIKKVIPKDNYQLEVQLENGSCILLDFSNKIQTIRFGMLADKTFFQQPVTDGDYIRWENKIEISISEVFELIQR